MALSLHYCRKDPPQHLHLLSCNFFCIFGNDGPGSHRYKVIKEALHCPLCKVVIAPKPGEDPNMVMSRHIDSGCVNPDAGKPSAYKYPCSKKKCECDL